MLIIIGLMFGGILVGLLLRKQKITWIRQLIMVLIWLLLLFLGIDVGGNPKIINGLYNIGLEALAITIAAVLGSVVAAHILWHLISKEKNS